MTRQITSIEESGSGLRTLLATTAITLVVLVGAALMFMWPDGDAAPARATAPVTTSTMPNAIQAPAAAPTTYIVASRAQADWLRGRLDEGAAARAETGAPEPVLRLGWFDSPEAEAGFWSNLAALRLHDDANGTALTVVDLRGRLQSWNGLPTDMSDPLDQAMTELEM
jgi:hypothetical protein